MGGSANKLKAKEYPANRCSLLANDVETWVNTLVRYRFD
jgi:hypothetical protein